MALERELETYMSHLSELKGENEGRFVLIRGDQVIDVFSSYDDARKLAPVFDVVTTPAPERAQQYEAAYRRYLDLYPRLKSWF